MTPAARLQAAIEILDEVIASARDDGPPADIIVTRYFKTRRYAGSGDRRAVRELVFRAIRRSAERPASGRAAMLGLAQDEPEFLALFGEVARAGADCRRRGGERRPAWSRPGSSRRFRRWSSPRNGRRCSSARRSTLGSMSRGRPATRCWGNSPAPSRRGSARGACGSRPTRGSTTIPPLPTAWSTSRTKAAS